MIELENSRASDATVSLISKSCSCVSIDALPVRLGAKQAVPLRFIGTIGSNSANNSFGAVVKLEWPDRVEHIVRLQQIVKLLPDVAVEPSALTVWVEENPRGKAQELVKPFKVSVVYRSDSQLTGVMPKLTNLPPNTAALLESEAYHRQLDDDLWESSWDGALMIKLATFNEPLEQVLTGVEPCWVEVKAKNAIGEVVSCTVPLTVRRASKRVSVHPRDVFLNKAVVRESVLVSPDKEAFEIRVEEADQDLPFTLKILTGSRQLIHRIKLTPHPGGLVPSNYRMVVSTTHPSSDKVEFNVIVLNNG